MNKFILQLPLAVKITAGLAAIAIAVTVPALMAKSRKQTSAPPAASSMPSNMPPNNAMPGSAMPGQNGMMPNQSGFPGMDPLSMMLGGGGGASPLSSLFSQGMQNMGLGQGMQNSGLSSLLGQGSQNTNSSSASNGPNGSVKDLLKSSCAQPQAQSMLKDVTATVYELPPGSEPNAENTASGTTMTMDGLCQKIKSAPQDNNWYSQIFFKL